MTEDLKLENGKLVNDSPRLHPGIGDGYTEEMRHQETRVGIIVFGKIVRPIQLFRDSIGTPITPQEVSLGWGKWDSQT